jgi:hypothetical protein
LLKNSHSKTAGSDWNKGRLTEFFQKTREFFPDSSLQVDSIFVSLDHVVSEWTLHTSVTEPVYGVWSRKVQISLFSSIPPMAETPVQGRAKPTLEWIGLLGGYGFAPNLSFDATFAAPHAMLLERGTRLASEVERIFSECIDRRYQAAFEGGSNNGPEACARYKERAAILEGQLIREREYLETLRGTHAFLVQEVQQLRERPAKFGGGPARSGGRGGSRSFPGIRRRTSRRHQPSS